MTETNTNRQIEACCSIVSVCVSNDSSIRKADDNKYYSYDDHGYDNSDNEDDDSDDDIDENEDDDDDNDNNNNDDDVDDDNDNI